MKKLSIFLGLFVILFGFSHYGVAQVGQHQSDRSNQEMRSSQNKKGHFQNRRGNRTPSERAKSYVDRLDKMLDLTADQKTKIEAIEKESMKSQKEVWEDKKRDRSDKREKFMELRKEQQKEVAKVLTKEQNEKLTQIRKKRRDQMKKRSGNRNRSFRNSSRRDS